MKEAAPPATMPLLCWDIANPMLAKRQHMAIDVLAFDALKSRHGWQFDTKLHPMLADNAALVVTDRSARIIWVSHTFSQLTGYTAASVLVSRPCAVAGAGDQFAHPAACSREAGLRGVGRFPYPELPQKRIILLVHYRASPPAEPVGPVHSFSGHRTRGPFSRPLMTVTQRIQDAETHVFKAVFPNTTNHYDTLFGGTALQWMDETVTVPIPAGTLVELIGRVDYIGRTSLKITVDIFVEEMYKTGRQRAIRGSFTFVAVDDNRRPTPL